MNKSAILYEVPLIILRFKLLHFDAKWITHVNASPDLTNEFFSAHASNNQIAKDQIAPFNAQVYKAINVAQAGPLSSPTKRKAKGRSNCSQEPLEIETKLLV